MESGLTALGNFTRNEGVRGSSPRAGFIEPANKTIRPLDPLDVRRGYFPGSRGSGGRPRHISPLVTLRESVLARLAVKRLSVSPIRVAAGAIRPARPVACAAVPTAWHAL